MKTVLRASSFYRDANCYANQAMGNRARELGNLPPQSTPDTERGTRVHEAKPATLDESDAMSWVIAQSYRVFDQAAGGESYDVICEKTLMLRKDGLIPYFSGHPDRFIVLSDRIHAVEFKPGFETDWESWEIQCKAYSALLWQTYSLPPTLTLITRFHGNRTFEWKPEELDRFIDEIKMVAGVYSDPEPTLTTPGPWCRYCRGRLICKDAIRFPEEALPLALKSEQLSLSLPGGEIGASLYEKLKRIVKIAEDRMEWYRAKVEQDPGFLAGIWILNDGRESPWITNPTAAMNRLEALNILSLPESVKCTSLSVSKLRQKIRDKNPKLSPLDAKETLDAALGDLIRYKKSEGWLVKANQASIENT